VGDNVLSISLNMLYGPQRPILVKTVLTTYTADRLKTDTLLLEPDIGTLKKLAAIVQRTAENYKNNNETNI
jgi:hypothetical protein